MTQKTVKAGFQSLCSVPHESSVRRFNLKVGRVDIFKPKTGIESLHQDSNDNGVRRVNLPVIYLVVKSMTFLHRNIHEYTCTSPDRNNQNQIDHILIDRRWHSGIHDEGSFRGAGCDTDHNLVAAKISS
jgi:hypothetical protein